MTAAAAIALTLADLDRRIADLRAARAVLAGLLAGDDPGKAGPPGEDAPAGTTDPPPPGPAESIREGAARLLSAGPMRAADLARGLGRLPASVALALRGPWFRRVSRGLYELTEAGRAECGTAGWTPAAGTGPTRSPPPTG